MKKLMISWICLTVGLTLAAGRLGATTAPRLTDEDLAEMADVILAGRCTHIRSVWLDRSLVTVADVDVDDVLKGHPVAQISVMLPGGIDTHRRVPVAVVWPGQPQIGLGEHVLLFLTRTTSELADYTILGFSQGKLSIVQDDAGVELVSRGLGGLALTDGRRIVEGGTTLEPLRDLERRIERYLEAPEGRGGDHAP